MAHLDEIKTEVAKLKTVAQSVITLLNDLAAKILEFKDQPVELAALAADIRSESTALAAAVTANTPAAPV